MAGIIKGLKEAPKAASRNTKVLKELAKRAKRSKTADARQGDDQAFDFTKDLYDKAISSEVVGNKRIIDSRVREGAQSNQGIQNVRRYGTSEKTGSNAARAKEEFREQNPNTVIDETNVPVDQEITIDQIFEQHEGRPLVPLPADSTNAGSVIESVHGVPLGKPVVTEGGYRYGYLNDGDWASNLSAARSQVARYENTANHFKNDPLAMFMSMGEDGGNFANMSSEVMIQLLEDGVKRFDIPERVLANFDDAIRETIDPKTGKLVFPEWTGVSQKKGQFTSQEERFNAAYEQLKNGKGDWRKAFMKQSSMATEARNKGFPDFVDVYEAVTAPRLRYSPTGSSGAVIVEPKIGKQHAYLDPDAHTAYDSRMDSHGVIGSTVDDIPHDIMFKDAWDKIIADGTLPENRFRRLQTTGQGDIAQKITPEWRDLNNTYLEVLNNIRKGEANPPPLKGGKGMVKFIKDREPHQYPKTQMMALAKVMTDAKMYNKGVLTPEHWNTLKSAGLEAAKLGALFGVVNGVLALNPDDLQASVFASGVKAAIKNLPMKKGTPQQFKAMLSKQKGVAGKEINAMDFNKLGNKSIGVDELNSFVDAEAPKVVMKIQEEGKATPEDIRDASGAALVNSDQSVNKILKNIPDGKEKDNFLQEVKLELMETNQRNLHRERKEALSSGMSATDWVDKKLGEYGSIKDLNISKRYDLKRLLENHAPEYVDKEGFQLLTRQDLQFLADDAAEKKMKYSGMRLEGGENYREIYFNLDDAKQKAYTVSPRDDIGGKSSKDFDTKEEAEAYVQTMIDEYRANSPVQFDELVNDLPEGLRDTPFKIANEMGIGFIQKNDTGDLFGTTYPTHPSGEQPNNMAWARIDDRVGENDEKIMNISELQSDTEKKGAPSALKKLLPKKWREGVLNKLMETAQAEGYDGITFAKTDKQVDKIEKWGSMGQGNNTYLVSPDGERKLTDQTTALSEYDSIDSAIEDAIDDVVVFGEHLEKLKKRRDIDEAENLTSEDKIDMSGMDRSIERMQKRRDNAVAERKQYEELKNSGYELDRVTEEVFHGSEGLQRVVAQYTEEMPEMVKKITGEDVQTMTVGDEVADHELNYIPLKNTDGTPKKIRESKFWQAAPVVGALGYGATQSDQAEAGVGSAVRRGLQFDVIDQGQLGFKISVKDPNYKKTEDDRGEFASKVLKDDNEVGAIWLAPDGQFASIDQSLLIPEYQGSGIGVDLYNKAIETAKEKGFQGLSSNPEERNIASDKFWSKYSQGFHAGKNTVSDPIIERPEMRGRGQSGIVDGSLLPAAAVAGAAGLVAQGQVNDNALVSEQRKAFESIKHTLPEDIETLEDYKRAFVNGNVNSQQYNYVIDQQERADKIIAEQQDTVLPNEVVSEEVVSEEVVQENTPSITTPQEQERKAKQQILKPVSEKVSPEGDTPIDYDRQAYPIPPPKDEERAERYTDAYDERGMDEAKRFGKILLGMGDAGLTIAHSMAAESTAGLGGMGVGLMHYLADDFEKLGATDFAEAIRPSMSASQMVEGMREGTEHRPTSTEYGGQMLEDLGGKVEEIAETDELKSFVKTHEEAGNWANEWGAKNVSPEFGAVYGTLASKWYELQPFI